MLRRIKGELAFIGENLGLIGGAAFFCAFGGILLWVNGSNIWYTMRIQQGRGLTLSWIFIIWLLTYGICGAVLAILFLHQGYRIVGCRIAPFVPFSLSCGVYLLLLVWYAVFFCTKLSLFAALLLTVSLILNLLVMLLVRRGSLILRMLLSAVAAVQAYFVYFTFSVV